MKISPKAELLILESVLRSVERLSEQTTRYMVQKEQEEHHVATSQQAMARIVWRGVDALIEEGNRDRSRL